MHLFAGEGDDVMAILCKHDWNLVDKTVFPNDLEEMKRLGYNVRGFSGYGILERKVVWWWKCASCNKIRKEVETS